jgi:predicted RNA binding protein YcfA (HicA-like mRNA interferase family)
MKIRDVIGAVEADGWRKKRTRGSHRQFKHPTKPGKVTIAGKLGDDIPAETLGSILRQAGLSRKDLR